LTAEAINEFLTSWGEIGWAAAPDIRWLMDEVKNERSAAGWKLQAIRGWEAGVGAS
jgi:hypothetical protein